MKINPEAVIPADLAKAFEAKCADNDVVPVGQVTPENLAAYAAGRWIGTDPASLKALCLQACEALARIWLAAKIADEAAAAKAALQ